MRLELLRLPSLVLRLAAGVPESGYVKYVPFDVIDHFAQTIDNDATVSPGSVGK